MEIQKLTKGELMEELLRNYFLSTGYFVVRGIKYKYENIDLTDVDLFLYGKSSTLIRHRINVDIKNKKVPQAFERVLWANGLMKLLNFDSCIVATTDKRHLIHTYAQQHNTIIFDGSFLGKLRPNMYPDRLTEEELATLLAQYSSLKQFGNKDWRYIYEQSKSKLLTELDFSGFNSLIAILAYFIEKVIIDQQKRDVAIRMVYLVLSHLLIIIDFIVKDIAFLEPSVREKRLSDGFKFGNLGQEGVDKIISMAVQISRGGSISNFMKTFDNIPADILKDYFSKNEVASNLFKWARDFEYQGYKRELVYPGDLDIPLKSTLFLMLDFNGIDRKRFLQSFDVQKKDESFIREFNNYIREQLENAALIFNPRDQNALSFEKVEVSEVFYRKQFESFEKNILQRVTELEKQYKLIDKDVVSLRIIATDSLTRFQMHFKPRSGFQKS